MNKLVFCQFCQFPAYALSGIHDAMIELQIKLAGGNRVVKVTGETQRDAFAQVAAAVEVFGETHCGLCGSTNIRPVHRVADKYHFYEYHCMDCSARLALGQINDNSGQLFPVRKLIPSSGKPSFKIGVTGKHNGWTQFKGQPADC